MTTLPRRYWQDMTTKEFSQADMERAIAVLPVAAIEQHGPHLPVSVDARINKGILDRALDLAPDHLPVTVLPAMSIGKSDEHGSFPGTLSLSAETLILLWSEIGESVWQAGVRKLVLFNSHGGQPQVLDIVARDLRVRLKMLVVAASWFRLGLPEGLFGQRETTHGIHGGGIETSMMMALEPDLVKHDELRDYASLSEDMAHEYKYLSPEGKVSFGWQTQDLNAYGACGDARDADPERGRQLIDHAAQALVDLLEEVDRFPIDRLRDRV